jgi:hypothetical protein
LDILQSTPIDPQAIPDLARIPQSLTQINQNPLLLLHRSSLEPPLVEMSDENEFIDEFLTELENQRDSMNSTDKSELLAKVAETLYPKTTIAQINSSEHQEAAQGLRAVCESLANFARQFNGPKKALASLGSFLVSALDGLSSGLSLSLNSSDSDDENDSKDSMFSQGSVDNSQNSQMSVVDDASEEPEEERRVSVLQAKKKEPNDLPMPPQTQIIASAMNLRAGSRGVEFRNTLEQAILRRDDSTRRIAYWHAIRYQLDPLRRTFHRLAIQMSISAFNQQLRHDLKELSDSFGLQRNECDCWDCCSCMFIK